MAKFRHRPQDAFAVCYSLMKLLVLAGSFWKLLYSRPFVPILPHSNSQTPIFHLNSQTQACTPRMKIKAAEP